MSSSVLDCLSKGYQTSPLLLDATKLTTNRQSTKPNKKIYKEIVNSERTVIEFFQYFLLDKFIFGSYRSPRRQDVVRACVRACVRECVGACVRACVRASVRPFMLKRLPKGVIQGVIQGIIQGVI